MSKQRKPVSIHAQTAKAAPVAGPALSTWPPFAANTRLHGFMLLVLGFLLYANTLFHGFVLDDSIVITDNMFTQQGVQGIPGILTKDTFFGFFKVEGKETLVSGGRYRPLTLVLFALIHQLAGANPFVFHLFTVLLFALTCWVFYRTLRLLLTPAGEQPAAHPAAVLTAFLAALLFTAHPIHTEVVANIKGCDEIATLLFGLGALYFAVQAHDSRRAGPALLSGALFFLACLSKENAAVFVLAIPVALWVFRRGPSVGRTVAASWPAWAAFILFFVIRGSILQWRFGGEPMELMNNPFLKFNGEKWVRFTLDEKLGTIFYTLGKYLQLMVWPHPLTHDYYPRHIGIYSLKQTAPMGNLLVYIILGLYSLWGVWRRDAAAFGILLYLAALSIVSNLVFPVGTNMGERFAFMASAGFCLAAAVWLVRLFKNSPMVPLVIAGMAALVFAVLTVLRNPVWESNERLFLTDVQWSPNSAKIRNACGGVLFDKARVETDEAKRTEYARQAKMHLDKALEIYPNYKDAYMSRGGSHFYLKNYDAAVADYRNALLLAPGDPRLVQSLAVVLREAGKYQGEQKRDLATAQRYLSESWQLNGKDPETARLLGVSYGVQGNNAEAAVWFAKAVELDPKNASYLFDLGTATALAGDVAKGTALRQQALQMDPTLGGRK